MANHDVTYAELLALMDVGRYQTYEDPNDALITGDTYTITDYATTVKSSYGGTVGGQRLVSYSSYAFNIVATAIDPGYIDEVVTLQKRSGTSRFPDGYLETCTAKYVTDCTASETDNSELLTKCPWALEQSGGGKGGIYELTTPNGLKAGYDLFNIRFLRYRLILDQLYIHNNCTNKEMYNLINYAITSGDYAVRYHSFVKYIDEQDLYEQSGNNYDGITILQSGTRVFCVIYGDGDEENGIICQVNGSQYFWTFSGLSSVTGSVEDLSYQLAAWNTQIGSIYDNIREANILPNNVVIMAGTSNAPNGLTISYLSKNNTIGAVGSSQIQGLYIDGSVRNTYISTAVINTSFLGGSEIYNCIFSATINGLPIEDTLYNVIDIPPTDTNYWQMEFRDLNNILYTIKIYHAPAGSPISLQGSNAPLTIQEDTNEECFTPIRNNTGYMGLYMASMELMNQLQSRNLRERPVAIYCAGQLIMNGFMSPQAFNIKFMHPMSSVKLPVTGALSLLDSVMFGVFDSEETVTFGKILYRVIAGISRYMVVPITTIYIDYALQMIGDGSTVLKSEAWLNGKVSADLFRKITEGGNYKMKYSCEEVMESFCNFFGLTFRMYRNGIYLLAVDDSERGNIGMLATSDLLDIDSATLVHVSFNTSSVLNNEVYASENNILKTRLGIRSIAINTDKEFVGSDVTVPGDLTADFPQYYQTDPRVVSGGTLWKVFEGSFKKTVNNWFWEAEGVTFSDFLETDGTRSSHSWSTYFFLNATNYLFNDYQGFARIVSPSMMLRNCVIALDGSGVINYATETIYSHLIVQIKIGGMYLAGSSNDNFYLTPTETAIELFFSNNGGIQGNKSIYNKCVDYDGWGVIINDAFLERSGITDGHIFGNMEIIFKRGYYTSGSTQKPIAVKDFSVNILSNEQLQESNGKEEHKAIGSFDFTNKKTLSTIFVSRDSVSMMLNAVSGVSVFKSATITETDYSPCAHYAERIAAYGRQSRTLLKLELQRSLVSVTPLTKLPLEFNGKTYYPVSISENYIENRMDIIAIEI